jgi:hypothetical protein
MTAPPEVFQFRIEKGELKLPECIEAAKKAMTGLSPLAVVRSATSPCFWAAAAKSIPDLVVKAVNVNVANVLANAWKVHRKLKKFTDPAVYPPGQASVVPLLTHDITGSLTPYIEISIDGQPQGKIEFELSLEVSVQGGVLVIQDGRIMRMEGGTAKVTGTLKCADVVVAERATREYAWKHGIDFGEGILIGAEA